MDGQATLLRRYIGIDHGKAGARRLRLRTCDDAILVIPEPDDYARRLRGLHRDVWMGVDANEYVRHEREAWAG